jgi:hypothetical protein
MKARAHENLVRIILALVISVISAPKPAGRAGVDGANAASGAWRATCRDELCSTIY